MTEPAPSPPPLSALDEAEKLVARRQFDKSISTIRKHWLANPDDGRAAAIMSQAMKGTGRKDLAHKLTQLSKPEAMANDAQCLFEVGFGLIDARELELAAMLLKRCVTLVPDDSTINYELGFALMSTRRFAEAIQYFERSASTDLKDYDSRLNLAVCYTLTRDLARAQTMVQAASVLAANDEEKAEIALRRAVLKRMDKLPAKRRLTPRDWLFWLYGSVLLSEPEGTVSSEDNLLGGGLVESTRDKCGGVRPQYNDIAWTLVILHGMLNELGMEFDVIEFYSPLSRPLAEALGHMMDLPVQGYKGVERRDRALLMMAWAPNIVGPHETFQQNNNKVVIFSYGLCKEQPLPLTPDICGQIVTACKMPWANTLEEEGEEGDEDVGRIDLPDEDQAKAMDKILEKVHAVQSLPDIIQTLHEMSDYYQPKRELLVAANAGQFKERAQYTAEIVY
jgi:Flp pilus assembly protein TadD